MGEGGEMTQTMYAHVNKKFKKKNFLNKNKAKVKFSVKEKKKKAGEV
jgi:hypothetical protein